MTHLIELLSGSIPGGVILLALALLFANLTIYFLKSSGLLIKRIREKYILVNTFFILVYALIWHFTLPERPPKRIIILPTQSDSTFSLNAQALVLADYLEQNPDRVQTKYIVHRWEWLYRTLGTDSVNIFHAWERLAHNLKPVFLIKSKRDGGAVLLSVYQAGGAKPALKKFPLEGFPENTLKFIQSKLNLFTGPAPTLPDERLDVLSGKLAVSAHRFLKAVKLLEKDTSAVAKVVMASAWVGKGLGVKIDRIKRQYVKIVNPDFVKAKKILHALVKERRNIAGIAFLLGRMAIRDEQFNDAEVFLKKALVDDPKNARTYYLLSYLLNERLIELGFKNRMEIMERAILFDPGYTDAVYDLANTYFSSGTGLEKGSGTLAARKTLMRFLKLQHNDPKILSMLATIDMKIKKYDDARKIFRALNKRYPNDSNGYYNLGILSFAQQKYDSALVYFEKAIKLDGNRDALLYAGLTEERLGNYKMALKYYRKRVHISTSEDDKYAREAMKGIRHVLRTMKKDSSGTVQ